MASNVYPNEASEHIERVLGNVAFQIPHSEEVKARRFWKETSERLVLKDSKGFRKTMEDNHKGGVRMLGERRSKAAFSAGLPEAVREETRQDSGHLTEEIMETEVSLEGLDGGEGIEENFQ